MGVEGGQHAVDSPLHEVFRGHRINVILLDDGQNIGENLKVLVALASHCADLRYQARTGHQKDRQRNHR